MIFQETEKTELKRELNDSVIKEIVAFLNSFDGIVYIGVNDDGTICGVKNLDETQKKIADIVTSQILPNPQNLIEIGTKYVDNINVVEIKVRKGNSLYYIKKYGRSATGCFVRIGTTCRSMTEDEIEKRYIATITIPRKTMKEEVSPSQDLSFMQFKSLLTFKNVHFNISTFEQNYNLRTINGKYNYIAFLASDQNDTSIKVVRFKGKTKAEFLSRKEFDGCIFKQMEDALEYSLNVLNIIQTNIVGKERVDTPYFDAEAFREAWFNAVCHNLWVEKTPPAIYGFDDRIEIISYGLLKEGMTKEEFFRGISNPVNDEFAKIFIQLHYMEQSGKGVPTIISKYDTSVYHFGSSFIQCVLPYNILSKTNQNILLGKNMIDAEKDTEKDTENIISQKKENANLNEDENISIKTSTLQKQIIELMKQEPKITIKDIAKKLKRDEATVVRNISKLKEKGLLERCGSDKTGNWKVK